MYGEWLESTRGHQPRRWSSNRHSHVQHASDIRCSYHRCEAPPPSTAQTCCHHRGRLHGRDPMNTAASATSATAGGSSPTPPSPEVLSPPPKRVRRRRNELELLRDAEGEGDLLFSPLSCTSPSPPSPSSSPSRPPMPSSATPSSGSPLRLPNAPLDHVPASPTTCPPTPPERPEPSPPAESAPASPPPPPPAAVPPTPSILPGYTIVYIWCPNCKNSLMDNRDFECYACQDRRYYYAADYEQE